MIPVPRKRSSSLVISSVIRSLAMMATPSALLAIFLACHACQLQNPRASRSFRASSSVKSFSSMLEGFTTLTVIPFFASSSANERDMAMICTGVRHFRH